MVQDPRLLGEIHIALLRSIIKDIEDVARTPTGVGVNHNSAANPSGGHPQIVEGVSFLLSSIVYKCILSLFFSSPKFFLTIGAVRLICGGLI